MKFVESKERAGYTLLQLETNDGDRVTITVEKNRNRIHINTQGGYPVIRPKTSNEITIDIVE